MGLSDKTKTGLEKWFTELPAPGKPSWKDRIFGWMVGWAKKGVTDALEDMEPSQKAAIEAMAKQLIDDPNTPPQVKAFLQEITKKGNPFIIAAGVMFAIFMIIPMVTAVAQPLGNILTQKQERLLRTFRLDPQAAITAWRRDPVTYAWVFDDLKDQGWPDRSIEALKFFTKVIPNAADIVRFALREVYTFWETDPYGQKKDIPDLAYGDAEKAGLSKDMFDKYWFAHWNLPSAMDGFEMLHRNILTEAQLKDLLKANDIMPYWRDQLIKLSWNIPTRVDVRRFWDMRTIDEARLREIYTGLGYHGQDLDDYVLWTKIYTDFPDLLARYKNGWITLDQVKRELIAMGMKPERADTMIEEKIKKAAPERVAAEKDLTKADIINGVKKGVITRVEAAELLTDIGYSNDEAIYLLDVNIPVDEETSVKTARELTKSDIAAAVKEQLISPAEAIIKLVALRYKDADATFLAALYAAQIPIDKVEPERELSKSDIISGLKAAIISSAEASIMLQKLRYSATDIAFIISSQVPKETVAKVRELSSGTIGPGIKQGILSPDEAISKLVALGYSSEDAAFIVALIREEQRQVEKADIRTARGIGAISESEAVSRLIAIGYTSDDASFLTRLYSLIDALSITTKPIETTKADIVTAVTKGLLTPSEGYTMLLNLGFTAENSNFILSIVAEESPFSPMTFDEFKDRSQKYRLAAGMEGKPMTEEIKRLGFDVIRLTGEVKGLEASIKAEMGTKLDIEGLPVTATARLRELQAALYKARVELARVKTNYNAKVTEWRYGAK